MEVVNHPRTAGNGSFWSTKIVLFEEKGKETQEIALNDWSYKTHVVDRIDTSYESMKEVVKKRCIISNNEIIIRNDDKKYGYVKISRNSRNSDELVLEVHYMWQTSIFTGGTYGPTGLLMPASKINLIPYTEDLKKLFDFVPFMK